MQMTTGGVAVVTTTLAQTDRRALSQAWYSALHLADQTKPQRGKSNPQVSGGGSSASRAVHGRTDAGPRVSSAAVRIVRRIAGSRTPALLLERRLPVGGLGRRIARLVSHPSPAPERARAATVSVRGARVHVIVRTQGNATRIVALCPRPLETRVARALAQARFALAARGVRVEVGV
jgi:hypothetical protein